VPESVDALDVDLPHCRVPEQPTARDRTQRAFRFLSHFSTGCSWASSTSLASSSSRAFSPSAMKAGPA
jgi:hypothetical protein